ncbi:MAG: tetratricopeptide repeat protein [Candidatus Wallbacteria bacterium]|nr:tetratricopeptide repeat protein [Candidatus Wallbacteria bacterium]
MASHQSPSTGGRSLRAVALFLLGALALAAPRSLLSAPPATRRPGQLPTSAISATPAPGGRTAEGLALLKQRKYREAFDILEPLSQARPHDKRLAKSAYLAGLSHLLELYKQKRYEEILSLGDHVTALDPDDYQSYFARGRALEELKRPAEAVDMFRRSRERGDRDFVSRALANAYLLMGDFPNAVQSFEEIVSAGKGKRRDLENLGVASYKSGDTEKAIHYLGKALELAPGDPAITALLARYTKEHGVQSNYSSASNAHFEVLFENTPAQRDLKEKLMVLLEAAYAEVTGDFGFRPEETVQVVIYPSGGAYREASDAPTWSAAVYDGKIRIPTGETRVPDEALQRILQHEFTHLVVEKLGGRRVPAWMNEGIAQVEEKREVPWAKPLLRRVLGNKNLRSSFAPLSSLEGSFIGLAGEQAKLCYAQAYYATKFILEMGGMWSFTQMLGDIKDGTEPADALKRATGYDYADFQKKWVSELMEDFHLAH